MTTPDDFLAEHGVVEPFAPRGGLLDLRTANVARWIGTEPPELRFVVADLVPRGMVTLLAGQGGAGKTLLLQLALTCCAAGHQFLGRDTIAGHAIGIFAEDPEAVLHLRQLRINDTLAVGMEDVAGRLFIRSLFGHDAHLWRDGGPTELMAALDDTLRAGPCLVTLDNAALIFGGNENDRWEVSAFMSALNGIADRRGAAIMLSTHQSKSRTDDALGFASGSTAWVNAARSALEITPAEDDKGPRLIVRKANHARPGSEIPLEWRDAVLTVAAGSADSISWLDHGRLDRLIFDEVAAAWRRDAPLTLYRQARCRYLPRLLATKTGLKAQQIEQRVLGWIASGHLSPDQKRTARTGRGLRIEKWPDAMPRGTG